MRDIVFYTQDVTSTTHKVNVELTDTAYQQLLEIGFPKIGSASPVAVTEDGESINHNLVALTPPVRVQMQDCVRKLLNKIYEDAQQNQQVVRQYMELFNHLGDQRHTHLRR